MTDFVDRADRTSQRARIEAMLADYPEIDPDRLDELIRWYRKEATASDVGLLASDRRLAESYRRFKADHIDRSRGADLLWSALFAMLAGICVAAIVWDAAL